MRRTLIALSSLVLFACQTATSEQPAKLEPESQSKSAAKPGKQLEPVAPDKRQQPAIVRKDLLAEELPPVPTLESLEVTTLASGELEFPEGTDELVPRAALALRDGLLLVGQAYKDRRPGTPSQSWRWTGFVPTSGEPRSTRSEPGAIRAGIVHEGQGLLTGTSGLGFDVRGWFAKVTDDGTITGEVALETKSATEMFDLIPGRAEGELAVLAGYVDAQGWLISLDAGGQRRWEKYIGSYGSTQVRALARLDDGNLLTIGTRGQAFGEAWSAQAPGDGGSSAAPDDVTQTQIEIEGVDPNSMLRAIVDLGDAGYLALGTAKRNHLQAHDQLFAVGFKRTGELAWSRVIEGVRATEVLGARVDAGAAQFILAVPLADGPRPELALALATVPPDPSTPTVVRRMSDGAGWSSAGFIEGSSAAELIASQASETGVVWRRLAIVN